MLLGLSLPLFFVSRSLGLSFLLLLLLLKSVQAHQARARDIGFIELDRSKLLYAFTYTVESAKHDNQPLWIKEAFALRVPLLALVHELADLWVMAYERRPQKDIVAVLQGG